MIVRIILSAFLIVVLLTAACIEGPADTVDANTTETNESALELQAIAADMQSGIDELSLALRNQSMALENISDATIESGDYKMNESSIILPKIKYASGQFEASAYHSRKAKEYFASAEGKVSNRSVLRMVRDYAYLAFYAKVLADNGVNFTAELQKPEPDPWWSVTYHGGVYTMLEYQKKTFTRTGINRTDLYAYAL